MIAWICDVNGVLVDAVAVARQAFAATAAQGGFAFGEREYRLAKGLSLLDAYQLLDPGSDAFARRRFHLPYVRERIPEIRAYPYVAKMLAAAQAQDIRIGAATSHRETAEAYLVNTGLYQYIDALVTQEEVRRPKPPGFASADPHPLRDRSPAARARPCALRRRLAAGGRSGEGRRRSDDRRDLRRGGRSRDQGRAARFRDPQLSRDAPLPRGFHDGARGPDGRARVSRLVAAATCVPAGAGDRDDDR